jgi:hypothetical protein
LATGIDWDMPIEPASVLPADGGADGIVAFERAYVREGFSGGPVAHIFESQSTLVGMTVKVDGRRVLARPIHLLFDRARAWRARPPDRRRHEARLPVRCLPAGRELERHEQRGAGERQDGRIVCRPTRTGILHRRMLTM